MLVSYCQKDHRECPVCGAGISSDLWMIIHRQERPKLWQRCLKGNIHLAACSNGHVGKIRAPLILYDPALSFLVYSPSPKISEAQEKVEFSELADRLSGTIDTGEKSRLNYRVEVIPRDLLMDALGSPELNVGSFMPGVELNEQSIELYEALQFSTTAQRQLILKGNSLEQPAKAAIQFDLALSLGKQMRENTDFSETIIEYLNLSMSVYNRNEFPHRWATIQSELAIVYHRRPKGDRKENLLEAIQCSRRALEVFQQDCFPEDYAIVHSNLANIYLDSVWDYPGSIKMGVISYEEALKIYNRFTYSDDWARVLSNYATAYMELKDPQSLGKAVHALESVLIVRKREVFEEDWAITQMNLGTSHLYLSESSTDAEIPKAITCLRSAYDVLGDKNKYPVYAVTVTYNLGLALAQASDQHSIIEAISLLELSRHTFIANGDYKNAIHCTTGIANCFIALLKSETLASNKFVFCQRAISMFKSDHDSEPVGILLHEIIKNILASKEESAECIIDIALKAARQLLSIFRKHDQLEYRAYGLMHLGIIYMRRPGINKKGNATLSLRCFNAALRHLQKLEPSPHRYQVMSEIFKLTVIAEQEIAV